MNYDELNTYYDFENQTMLFKKSYLVRLVHETISKSQIEVEIEEASHNKADLLAEFHEKYEAVLYEYDKIKDHNRLFFENKLFLKANPIYQLEQYNLNKAQIALYCFAVLLIPCLICYPFIPILRSHPCFGSPIFWAFFLMGLVALIGLTYFFLHLGVTLYFSVKKAQFFTKQLYLVQKFDSNNLKLKSLEKQIVEHLVERVILPFFREKINAAIEPSYSLKLEKGIIGGLSEVTDASNFIDTSTKIKLDFLLDTMPGGSIGIAGARGAGKSTLIVKYCRDNNAPNKKNENEVIGIYTTSPVEYEVRDFILHLFSLTCSNIIKKYSEHDSIPSYTNMEFQAKFPSNKFKFPYSIFKFSVYLLIVSGMLAFLASAFLYKIKVHYNGVKPVVGVEDFSHFYLHSISKSESLILNLMLFATAALVTSLLLAITLLVNKRYLSLNSNREILTLKTQFQDFDDTNAIYARRNLASKAQAWLTQIRFQQSFTTGWTGGLKVPILEGEQSKAMTLSERQMSNPEIVSEFKSFLQLASSYGKIIIGIDELDKIESDISAVKFINEIKSLFGVPHCFFLISVSENAINNFERRGLPFRDAFDSAFDTILYVDSLKFSKAEKLLQKRIIGRPITFLSLAYCLAGGLPRDLIRYYREIVRLSKIDNSLNYIMEQLLEHEIKAKLRGTLATLNALTNFDESKTLFMLLFEISIAQVRSAQLTNDLGQLQLIINELNSKTEIDDKHVPEYFVLNKIAKETQAYLMFCRSMLRTFTNNVTEEKIVLFENTGKFDELANARHSFSLNHDLTIQLLSKFDEYEDSLQFMNDI